MTRSTKHTAPTAASQRPSKKRKSAEASLAKTKKAIDAENTLSEDEKEEFKHLVWKIGANHNDRESEGEDEDDFERHEIVPQDAVPVVAPGFRLWQTHSKLCSKGELSHISKYDDTRDEYSKSVKVRSDEEFTLVPLIVTQGPYQGRRLIMLEPTHGFRLFDFPAEIRNHIYSFMVEADDCKIVVRTSKKVHRARLPVLGGKTYDRKSDKWLESPTLFSTLLRINKQILREAASILYGVNHFQFSDLGELKIFLDRIGSMRPYLRYINIGDRNFQNRKARGALCALKDASDLRELTFQHEALRLVPSLYNTGAVQIDIFVRAVKPLLKTLQTSRTGSTIPSNVLDIIRIGWERCNRCMDTAPAFPDADGDCVHGIGSTFFGMRQYHVLCKNAGAHCTMLEERLRKLFAKELDIEAK